MVLPLTSSVTEKVQWKFFPPPLSITYFKLKL